MKTEIHRPAGLVVVVVITAVFAAFGLLICGLALMAVSTGKATLVQALIFLVCFALSIAEAVTCFGLWNREDWGISLAQIIYALNIILSVITIFWAESSAEVLVNVVGILTYTWMFIYVSGL